jgi:hypothetical protein
MTSLPTRHAIAGMIAAQALYMSTGAAIAAAPTGDRSGPPNLSRRCRHRSGRATARSGCLRRCLVWSSALGGCLAIGKVGCTGTPVLAVAGTATATVGLARERRRERPAGVGETKRRPAPQPSGIPQGAARDGEHTPFSVRLADDLTPAAASARQPCSALVARIDYGRPALASRPRT